MLMKAGFRQQYLICPQIMSSFSSLGILLDRFSSVIQCIWTSEIPARAGSLLWKWRNLIKEVAWFASESSENNLNNGIQQEQVWEGKQCHGLCKSKGETTVKGLRTGQERQLSNEGRRLKRKWKSWTVRVATRKLWEKNTWDVRKVMLGRSHFHYATFKPRVMARDGDTHSRELVLSHSSCQKYTSPLARTMPQNTYISVDISRKKGAN